MDLYVATDSSLTSFKSNDNQHNRILCLHDIRPNIDLASISGPGNVKFIIYYTVPFKKKHRKRTEHVQETGSGFVSTHFEYIRLDLLKEPCFASSRNGNLGRYMKEALNTQDSPKGAFLQPFLTKYQLTKVIDNLQEVGNMLIRPVEWARTCSEWHLSKHSFFFGLRSGEVPDVKDALNTIQHCKSSSSNMLKLHVNSRTQNFIINCKFSCETNIVEDLQNGRQVPFMIDNMETCRTGIRRILKDVPLTTWFMADFLIPMNQDQLPEGTGLKFQLYMQDKLQAHFVRTGVTEDTYVLMPCITVKLESISKTQEIKHDVKGGITVTQEWS